MLLCGEGTVFDAIRNRCTVTELATCILDITTPGPTTTEATTTTVDPDEDDF
jgi:hypothetical protein